MTFLNNILSVAKYESKLLKRSWFFKVFSVLSVSLIAFVSVTIMQTQKFAFTCIPSMAAYNLMLYFNVAQAIVSIFLASEYLKRDKQLDTSEVFYVRPLSNAEYLLGKMWGTIQVFILLNLLVMIVALTVCYIYIPESVSPLSFVMYFFILNLPTLIYIIGLSTLMMLLVKNQALTFVILLGYIGLTLFYIGDKCYYLFDYIGFNIPLLESTITGFADLQSLIVHRVLYLLLGIGFILCSISLFRRLPNSPRALYPWRAAATIFLLGGFACGGYHVSRYIQKENFQQEMIALNNRYASDPKMEIDSCSIEVVQNKDVLHFETHIVATPVKKASVFTFTLNPGFEVKSATMEGSPLTFKRESHLLWLEFPKEIADDETVRFTLEYEGIADERICYLYIPEELLIEQEKFMNTFNVGKRYLYQTEDYTLLTPESYWYPRPGVCYSDENPDWQQSYFTSFQMNVKPNPGLVAISQGERTMSNDSMTVSFKPEYPLQSLSLIIGHYNDVSVEVDNTLYSVWYLDGHGSFINEFTLIKDTIPSIIRDVRFDYEELVEMEYPFNRFSIVETPAHLSSYTRAWTGAQEKMQPEMVLVPERMYNNWRFNIKGLKESRKSENRGGRARGGGGGRRQQNMTDEEIEMQIFRDMLSFMRETNAGMSFQRGQMGRNTITTKESPYYIFAQMYNFRYNIYSTEWPVANRMIELMLQGNQQTNNWLRNVNGLSNDEKSLMLMQRYSFKEVQNLTDHRDLLNNLIKLQGKKLFLDAERKMGVQAFKDTLFAHIKTNAFKNLSFEALLDTLEMISHTQLKNQISDWNHPTELTEFMIGTPSVTKIETETMEIYQAEIIISNLSNQPGSINMKLEFWSEGNNGNSDYQIFDGEEKPVEWIVDFKPHETKRIVTHWEENPGTFIINTLFSKNLPVQVTSRNQRVEEVYVLTPEGEYTLSEDFMYDKEEVIVDNEDEALFTLSTPPPSGYLGEWITKDSEEEEFKYIGISEWQAPARWTSTTDQNYYGRSIRSAVHIRAGKGTQYAQWKIPVPNAGRYELYYHVRRPEQLRRENRWGRIKYLYNFTVKSENDDYEEKAELDMRRADEGWNLIGTYGLTGDTLIVRLTDKSELNMIAADAVKLVKKN
ncbi:MAG: xanthan lyase [Bacteroidaceae bacterium]|nr:xanthan lyase [Bacteroidaceae bacterium]